MTTGVEAIEQVRKLMDQLGVTMNDLDTYAYAEDVLMQHAQNDETFKPDLRAAYTALAEEGYVAMRDEQYEMNLEDAQDRLEEHGFLPNEDEGEDEDS